MSTSINISSVIILSKLKRKTLNQIQQLVVLSKDDQTIVDSFRLIEDIFLNYVFSKNTNYNSNDVKFAMNICIVEQLQVWARKNFVTIIQMLNQLKIDRDAEIQIISNWNSHVENYNSLLKDFEKVEKNKRINREIASILRRESRIIDKLNTQIEELNRKKQNLHDEIDILRLNSAITSTFQNDIKLKIDNAKLVNRNIELQNEINSLKTQALSISFRLLIDKRNKSVKMSDSLKFSENTSNLSYEIWKQFVKNKFIVNVDHFVDEYTKTTTLISWIEDKIREHVFARRNVDMIFFKTSQMIFDVLSLIYAKKNKKRNICNKFKVFIMRINQRFSKFFSKFLLLFSQLSHYSQQNLTDELREKLISQLQRVIVSNGRFSTIESLKKLIEKVNQEFHSLKDYQVIKFEIFIRADQSTNRKINVKFSTRVFVSSAFKKFSISKLIALKNLQVKEKTSSNCYKCETLNHWSKNCSESESTVFYIQKILRKEKNALKIHNIVDFLFKSSTQLNQIITNDEISETSEKFFFEHESKNV